jgi:GT2 family glycosyltransferase
MAESLLRDSTEPNLTVHDAPARDAASTSNFRCSIIVPVYNGRAIIERCLDAIATQSLPQGEVEVIVVDDGSTDDTADRVEAWAQRHPNTHLTLARQKNAGPAAARNHGARLAHAPLLLFTDADCAPDPDWAVSLIGAFADDNAELGVVGAKGAYLTDQRDLVPRFVQAEYEDRYDRMIGQERIDFIDTYAAAYRRDIFLENGGFDATFTTASVEDQEFSFRLAQKGYRMVFVPQARVRHIHDENLAEYARRKYYIGFW